MGVRVCSPTGASHVHTSQSRWLSWEQTMLVRQRTSRDSGQVGRPEPGPVHPIAYNTATMLGKIGDAFHVPRMMPAA